MTTSQMMNKAASEPLICAGEKRIGLIDEKYPG
jgi:hypothetical protein